MLKIIVIALAVIAVIIIARPLIYRLFVPDEYERRRRNGTAVRLQRSLPQLPGETEEDTAKRVHALLIEERGLPRAEHVAAWLKKGRLGLVPPRDQIEAALNDYMKSRGPSDPETINATTLLALVDEVNQRPLDDEDEKALEILRKHGASGE